MAPIKIYPSKHKIEIINESTFDTDLNIPLAYVNLDYAKYDIVKTIEKIALGTADRIKQDDSLACYAKKVEKEDCKLDFTLSAKKLDYQIRGVTPIPGAFAYLNGKMLKINKLFSFKV